MILLGSFQFGLFCDNWITTGMEFFDRFSYEERTNMYLTWVSLSHISYTPSRISKPGVFRLCFTIPCREHWSPASWWAFQYSLVLKGFLLPFLALLLSSALSLMLEETYQTKMRSASVHIPSMFGSVLLLHQWIVLLIWATVVLLNCMLNCLKSFCIHTGLLAILPPLLVTDFYLLRSGGVILLSNLLSNLMSN